MKSIVFLNTKIYRYIFFLLIFVFLYKPTFARSCCDLGVIGADTVYLSRGLESFALGGSTAGLEMNPRNFAVNPATASTMLQKMVMLNAGYGTESINFLHAGYLHPTEYGVFGGMYSHFYDLETSDIMITLGPVASKELNRYISLGMILVFDYYKVNDVPEADVMPFGFNGGISVNFRADWNFQKSIFALKEFLASVQVDQVGLVPWRRGNNGEKVYLKNSDLFKLGFGFTFIELGFKGNSGKWKSRLISDTSLTYPIDYGYTIGLKNSFLFDSWFQELSFMIGHYRDPGVNNPFPLNAGLGMVFKTKSEVKVEVGYAFGLRKRGTMESVHALGFNIFFGEVDDRKPDISSPFGNEGVIDSVIIE